MASVAKSTTDAAGVILSLSPRDIQTGDRLGAFWPVKAAAIGRLMAEDGQNEPIKVKRNGPRATQPWTLVVGLHRLEGAKLENFAVIEAIEVNGDDATLRKIEASENVERGSRSPIERACFVRAIADAAEARLKDQHEGLSQQQVAIRARWDAEKSKAQGVVRENDLNDAEVEHTAANFATVYGWQESTAEALGLSKRTIRDDLALHRALVAPFPDLYRDLATHPIVGENASALREIASYAVDARRDIIESLGVTVSTASALLASGHRAKRRGGTGAPASAGSGRGKYGASTAETETAIMDLYDVGKSYDEIAARLNMRRESVKAIVGYMSEGSGDLAYGRSAAKRASDALLSAIARHHPERCSA